MNNHLTIHRNHGAIDIKIDMLGGVDNLAPLMIIANGNRPDNLYDIMDGLAVGTKFTGVMV